MSHERTTSADLLTVNSWPRAVKHAAVVVLAVVALGLLISCGSDPTATPIPTPTSPAADPAATPNAMQLFEKEWNELIAAAQAEGKISIALTGSSGREYRPVVGVFADKFGVDVIVSTGSGRELGDRLVAEQAGGRYEVDIFMAGAGGTFNSRLMPNNAIVPIPPLLIHPEVTDGSLWYGGHQWWGDPTREFAFLHSTSLSVLPVNIWYNTDLVSQADVDALDSIWDFLEPEWNGKIVAIPPTIAGASGSWHGFYVREDIGPEWIEKFLIDANVTFVEDLRLITDGVALGKYHVGLLIGSAGRDLDVLITQGAPVKKLEKPFKEPGALSGAGGANAFSVVINAPHPNATKLFVNWFLSKEGATAIHDKSENQPPSTLRIDGVPQDRVPLNQRIDPNASYLFIQGDPAIQAKFDEAIAFAVEAYGRR